MHTHHYCSQVVEPLVSTSDQYSHLHVHGGRRLAREEGTIRVTPWEVEMESCRDQGCYLASGGVRCAHTLLWQRFQAVGEHQLHIHPPARARNGSQAHARWVSNRSACGKAVTVGGEYRLVRTGMRRTFSQTKVAAVKRSCSRTPLTSPLTCVCREVGAVSM